MLRLGFALSMGALGATMSTCGPVSAQNYPTKPIRIVAAEAGGGGDLAARFVAQGLSANLGQQVVVDNRGNIGMEIVARAPPDGYTLLFKGNPVWLLPFLQDKVPYDPVKDFAPVTLAVSTPNILVVGAGVPVKSGKELLAFAKARPGILNYGSGSSGSSTHLAAELFNVMAGVNIVHISYQGTGPALNAVIGGQVQVMFAPAPQVIPQLRSDRLKALAVTSAQPSKLVPDLPTVASLGLPGYEAVAVIGYLAPAKTTTALVHRLNHEILRVLNTPEMRARLFNVGIEVVGNSPEQFAEAIKSEMATMGKLIKDAGIRTE